MRRKMELRIKPYAYVCKDCLCIMEVRYFMKDKCPECKSRKFEKLYKKKRTWKKKDL